MSAALEIALADTRRAAETAARAADLLSQSKPGDVPALLAAVKRYADNAEKALTEAGQ